MPLRADLLTPIAGPSPAGIDLRYDPLYDKIKEARHEDDDAPLGDWQRPRKTADFALVTKLAGEALASRSKDLQLAAWLTEAQLRREGFPGLRSGLELLHAMLDRFWDTLYPPLEEGDPELRAAPLAWVGLTLPAAVRAVPLNRSGHDYFKYMESRAVGSEADTAGDPKRAQARQQAIDDGRLTPEDFDKGVDATPKSWYKEAAAGIRGSMEALEALDRLAGEKFGDAAPEFRRLQEALAEVQRVVAQVLARKLEAEPDPPEPLSPAAPAAEGDRLGTMTLGVTPVAPNGAEGLPAEPADRADATARAGSAARFLRRTEPGNPASYLLLRGLRWGELRARGDTPDPRLLEAPSSQVRTQLKTLLLEGRWPQLLEASESVMATAAGRGWLDLQRYTLSACAALGSEYDAVTRAIRGELRTLLADMPGLVGMSLMDDLPTANPDTRRWLREEGLTNGAPTPDPPELEVEAPTGGHPMNGRSSDPCLERAMVEVRGGRAQRAIELLMEELGREKTPRARFLRRTQIARIMVDTGLEAIAVPILRDLLALIETHRLPEWEAGELVAEPMALLYRCIEKLPDEGGAGEHSRASLYPRICSLDPLQALQLSQP